MTDYEIKTLAHRTAWKYNHSDESYTFDDACIVDFVRRVQTATIEACARVCDANADACDTASMMRRVVSSQAAAIRSMLPNQTSGTSTETKP